MCGSIISETYLCYTSNHLPQGLLHTEGQCIWTGMLKFTKYGAEEWTMAYKEGIWDLIAYILLFKKIMG